MKYSASWGDMADELLPTPAGEPPACNPKRPTGVLVLSTYLLQPLYINQQAQAMCERARIEEETAAGRSVLPQALLDYSRKILRVLEMRLQASNWERFITKPVSMPSNRQALIRGMGVPDGNGLAQSRILLFIEDRDESPFADLDQPLYRVLLDDRDPTSSALENFRSSPCNGSH